MLHISQISLFTLTPLFAQPEWIHIQGFEVEKIRLLSVPHRVEIWLIITAMSQREDRDWTSKCSLMLNFFLSFQDLKVSPKVSMKRILGSAFLTSKTRFHKFIPPHAKTLIKNISSKDAEKLLRPLVNSKLNDCDFVLFVFSVKSLQLHSQCLMKPREIRFYSNLSLSLSPPYWVLRLLAKKCEIILLEYCTKLWMEKPHHFLKIL